MADRDAHPLDDDVYWAGIRDAAAKAAPVKGSAGWYADRAAEIPWSVFEPLQRQPVRQWTNPVSDADLLPAIRVRFTPGDDTVYDITLVATGRDLLVAVRGMAGRVELLPMMECSAGYVASKLRIDDPPSVFAVTAVLNRAAKVAADLPSPVPEL